MPELKLIRKITAQTPRAIDVITTRLLTLLLHIFRHAIFKIIAYSFYALIA
jgi:hypothetical protein